MEGIPGNALTQATRLAAWFIGRTKLPIAKSPLTQQAPAPKTRLQVRTWVVSPWEPTEWTNQCMESFSIQCQDQSKPIAWFIGGLPHCQTPCRPAISNVGAAGKFIGYLSSFNGNQPDGPTKASAEAQGVTLTDPPLST